MTRIASDALIERLADWGVDTVFGRRGTASTESWKACGGTRTRSASCSSITRRPPPSWRPRTPRRATGQIGVSLAMSGPGGIHLLNGLYDLPDAIRAALSFDGPALVDVNVNPDEPPMPGYSIETPRLLLNSASSRFPDGLCNDFDQVGRYLMVQGPTDRRALRRGGADVQGTAARSEQRGVLRDRGV
jgi:hypothetical protein